MASLVRNSKLTTLAAVTILAAVISAQHESTKPCPDACSCPSIPPALGLVCNGRNLTAIPAVNMSAHFVDFSGNPLRELTNRTLAPIRDAGDNLQILVLKACAICSIESDAFDGIRNLRFVDLSSNGLSTLAPGVFTQLSRLSEINLSENNITAVSAGWFAAGAPIRVLNLTANPIKHLGADVFGHLSALEELRLDQCQLHLVDPAAFDGLFRLHTLNLSGNHLTTFTPDSITWLRELHTLQLDANPWECNCDLQAVTVMLLMRGFQTLAANLTCSTNQQELTKWIDVNTTHPGCESHIKMHARKTSLVGNSAKHRSNAKPLSTNASRSSAPKALFSSHSAAATSAYSSVATVSIWCAIIILLAVFSYVGIYVTSKMCVYATTKATSVAKHASAATRKSIVRRQNSECERALVDDTALFRDHFYLVAETTSDVNTSI